MGWTTERFRYRCFNIVDIVWMLTDLLPLHPARYPDPAPPSWSQSARSCPRPWALWRTGCRPLAWRDTATTSPQQDTPPQRLWFIWHRSELCLVYSAFMHQGETCLTFLLIYIRLGWHLERMLNLSYESGSCHSLSWFLMISFLVLLKQGHGPNWNLLSCTPE